MTDWAHATWLGIPAAPFVAALLASLLCGFVGTFVVLRRLVALGGGIAHSAFGGIGVAVVLGFAPRVGAIAVAVVTAALLAARRREEPDRQDALIGVLWSVGMALGMLLLAGTTGEGEIEGYLFGDLARVHAVDLGMLAGVAAAVLVATVAIRREIVATAFDVEHARLQGLPVGALQFLMLLLVALSVVALVSLVGIVLAIALLSIPPLVALRLCRGLPAIVAAGCAVGLGISVAGMAIAVRAGWPAGPSIVLVGAAALGLAQLVPRRRSRAA
jgi:zinc transport system permease protein